MIFSVLSVCSVMSSIAKKAKKAKKAYVIRGIRCFFLLDSTVINSQ